jgi:hypothetical protein
MADAKPSRRNFTLYFILVMLAISAGVFFSFRGMMRSSVAMRSEVSRAHLQAIYTALKRCAAPENKGAFPDDLQALYPKFISDGATFIHPAWPERPGYVYVSGVRPNDPPTTMIVYENIPESKQRLPRLVLMLDGSILSLEEGDFEKRLTSQASLWQGEKRPWQPRPVNIEQFLSP